MLVLDDEENSLKITGNYPAPFNASWVEHIASQRDIDHLIGISEGDDAGLLYSFEIDNRQNSFEITSQQETRGAPAHFITLSDKSAIVLATYFGGSVTLYPILKPSDLGTYVIEPPAQDLLTDFVYQSVQHGPHTSRQWQSHPHQVIEDSRGLLFVPDLGSDRVWILHRDGIKLEIGGWLQCPPGSGPRHAVITPNENMMYVLGELSHNVTAFDISAQPSGIIQPIDGFEQSVVPPGIHKDHQYMMDSAELCLHPNTPGVLYASNRWERHVKRLQPQLKDVPGELPLGDSIAILLLSEDGRKVEEIKHTQTSLDVIRGMRLSKDGKFVAVVGQEGGGIEIYEISGLRAETWTHRASLSSGLESGIKHIVWL